MSDVLIALIFAATAIGCFKLFDWIQKRFVTPRVSVRANEIASGISFLMVQAVCGAVAMTLRHYPLRTYVVWLLAALTVVVVMDRIRVRKRALEEGTHLVVWR